MDVREWLTTDSTEDSFGQRSSVSAVSSSLQVIGFPGTLVDGENLRCAGSEPTSCASVWLAPGRSRRTICGWGSVRYSGVS
jgi:hypothetical protein